MPQPFRPVSSQRANGPTIALRASNSKLASYEHRPRRPPTASKVPFVGHDSRSWAGHAKKLVRAFGKKVFDVIEATPDRLREVDDIGRVRTASILAAWAEQKAVREIMVFLHSHGVGTARAVRIFRTYGPTLSRS